MLPDGVLHLRTSSEIYAIICITFHINCIPDTTFHFYSGSCSRSAIYVYLSLARVASTWTSSKCGHEIWYLTMWWKWVVAGTPRFQKLWQFWDRSFQLWWQAADSRHSSCRLSITLCNNPNTSLFLKERTNIYFISILTPSKPARSHSPLLKSTSLNAQAFRRRRSTILK